MCFLHFHRNFLFLLFVAKNGKSGLMMKSHLGRKRSRAQITADKAAELERQDRADRAED